MNQIEIEHYPAGKDVLLVLTGLGGSVKGYQNKYETLAKNIVSKFNYTVFVATTPHGSWENSKENIDSIINYIDKIMEDKNYKIYVFGHSAGGTFALWHGHLFPKIKRIIASNPVLNVNFHRIKNGIDNFNGELIKVIIGEKDQCFKFAGLLKENHKAETIILENVDHEYTGNLEKFINLPNDYLFANK